MAGVVKCQTHELPKIFTAWIFCQDAVVYSIIDAPPDTDLFYLNPVTGVLSLKQLWPRQDKQDYRVSLSLVFLSHSLAARFSRNFFVRPSIPTTLQQESTGLPSVSLFLRLYEVCKTVRVNDLVLFSV